MTEGPGTDLAGVDGEIALTPNEAAVKLEVDADGTDADLENLAVEDDFAGRFYDAPMEGPDAVYVHRGGAYTTEVRDAEGAHGAFRVNPDPAEESGRDAADGAARVRIETPDTGKASLSGFVSTISRETALSVDAVTDVALEDVDPLVGGGGRTATATPTGDGSRDGTPTPTDDGGVLGDAGRQTGGVTGLLRALKAVLGAADRATEAAAAGDRPAANRALETVAARLADVRANLEGARSDLPEPTARAVEARIEQAIRRTEQALETEKL